MSDIKVGSGLHTFVVSPEQAGERLDKFLAAQLALAAQAISRTRIKALIDAETAKNILSDQQLAEMLQKEGFDLARRTVAKYREAIGLGSSAERRRAKKLAGASQRFP